jgi:DNA repair protein RecO (recombination protein O)
VGFYNTEALILKARDWGEADQLITLFSRDRGRLVAAAKGIRKPQSRLRGGAQVLSHSELMLHTGRSMDRITGSQSIHGFNLGDRLEKLTCGMYWADLLDRILPEREANPPIFELALKALTELEAADSSRFPLEAFSLFFEWNLINLMGYQPFLDGCVLCQRTADLEREREFTFSAAEGGLLCRGCSQETGGGITIAAPTLAILRRWSAISFSHFNRIAVSPASRLEINSVAESVLRYHLERDLPSRGFLDRLGG